MSKEESKESKDSKGLEAGSPTDDGQESLLTADKLGSRFQALGSEDGYATAVTVNLPWWMLDLMFKQGIEANPITRGEWLRAKLLAAVVASLDDVVVEKAMRAVFWDTSQIKG